MTYHDIVGDAHRHMTELAEHDGIGEAEILREVGFERGKEVHTNGQVRIFCGLRQVKELNEYFV